MIRWLREEVWSDRTRRREWVVVGLLTLFMVSLGYAALFHVRESALDECHQRNAAFEALEAQSRQRTEQFNRLVAVNGLTVPPATKQSNVQSPFDLGRSDCEADYDKPWPF